MRVWVKVGRCTLYTVQYITEEGDVRGGKRDGSDKGV